MSTRINKHTIDQQRQSLANFFPGSCLFAARNIPDTTLFRLMRGIAVELVRMECALVQLEDQYLPDVTVDFIREWEESLGIPDDCFDGQGTIEERRRDVVVKLALMNVQTRQDFIDLAAIYGFDIKIESLCDRTQQNEFPFTFPLTFEVERNIDRFYVVFVTFLNVPPPEGDSFPYIFPFVFGRSDLNVVQCLFNKLKPILVKICYEFNVDDRKVFPYTFPFKFETSGIDIC